MRLRILLMEGPKQPFEPMGKRTGLLHIDATLVSIKTFFFYKVHVNDFNYCRVYFKKDSLAPAVKWPCLAGPRVIFLCRPVSILTHQTHLIQV